MLMFQIDVGNGYCAINGILSSESSLLSDILPSFLMWEWTCDVGRFWLVSHGDELCACVHSPIGSHIVARLSSLHCRILEPCHRTFETATIVNEASCTNQYITPHPHHSNNTKQHAYFNTHQWWLQITIQQSNAVGD